MTNIETRRDRNSERPTDRQTDRKTGKLGHTTKWEIKKSRGWSEEER